MSARKTKGKGHNMHKRLHKVVSLALAGLLFLTSTFTNVGQSYAAESVANGDVYETTYAIAELGTPGGYQYTAEETEEGITFNYSAQYAEVKYAIPEDVVKAGLKGYRVSVSSTPELGLKIYKTAGEADVNYWSDSIEFTGGVPTEIGFMNCADAEKSFTFSSVTFVTERELGVEAPVTEPEEPVVEPEEPVVEPTEPAVEVTDLVFNENLTFAGRWDNTPTESNVLTFGAQYNEFVFDLGKTLNSANVESVTVAFAEQNDDVTLKLYGEGFAENLAVYHNTGNTEYTLVPNFDGEIRYVGIMSIPEGEAAYPYSVTVSSITVKVNNKAVEPEKPVTEGLDEYTNLSFADRWSNAPAGSNVLSFDGQYQEYVVDLGKTYPTNEVNFVNVAVSDQGNNVCIKLYDSEMNEKMPNYSNNGKSEYSIVPNYDGDVRYIGIMSMPAADDGVYPYSITIDKISVKYTPVVYEETDSYGPEDLVFTERWEGAAVEGNTLSFAKEWTEYWFALRKPVKADKIKSLKINVKDQGLTVAFKLYDANGTELQAFYGQNGKTTYSLSYAGDEEITNIAVMSMNGQDDVFPATITIDSVEIVIDTTPETEPPVEKGVEYDIVNLRDEMTAVLGEDFIVGTAISYQEFADSMEMELVTKHFNGVTLGNELKPDSMLKQNAERVMVELNGEEILFPVLDFSNPDRYLDFFVNWNNEHPEKKIRIRGHVLVWHSQTPDFFFREDYDTSKGYVTPEVMNKRLEAYIRGVCEHYTSEGSKYKDLFYGWDVVNEAVSDGTGTYRNASENSTWWRVYGSPEFINNAFVYTNRYMPANIALFYNDYNAYQPNKAKGILNLIRNVQATPGSRIDGMGMQAHYFCEDTNPTMEAVKKAATDYGKLVDQVQFTEIDFKGSTGPKDEQLAKRYKDLYDTVRRLIEEGTNVTGFTIWGVVDKHSWLQTANGAGGGSNGNSKQYPLLFDNNYKAKPAFYALCNAGELEPEIRNVSMVQDIEGYNAGEYYSFKEGVAEVSPTWNSDGHVNVLVKFNEELLSDEAFFTVYASDGNGIQSVTVTRDMMDSLSYCSAYFDVSKEAIQNNKIKFDVVITDGDKQYAFCDTSFSQETTDKYYAVAATKPLLGVKFGTVKVDGVADDAAWASVEEIPLTINLGADVSATAKLLWDTENLYVLMYVKDAVLNDAASQAHEQDSIEIFIDENNGKSGSYQEDDKQYRINFKNVHSFNGTKCVEDNILSEAVLTEEGYMVEASFKWTDIEAKPETRVGLELQVNDANANGTRSGTLSWADKTGNGWSAPEVFGTIFLVAGEPEPYVPEPKNGIYEEDGGLYYYENDVRTYAGLIEMCDGTFCYVKAGGVVARGHYYVTHGNGIMDKCHADFDEVTGRMLINGIKKVYGEDRYYVDGYLQKDAGVVRVGAYYYYVDEEGKIVKTPEVEVTNTNGILSAGTYKTGNNGILILDGVLTVNGQKLYYKNNKIGHRAGLVEWNGDFYYVIENGVLETGFVTVKKTNSLKEYGVYEFDADGKMITDKNGFVDENGSTYYYVDGKRTYAGLVEIDGDLYYVAGDCKMVKGKSYFITHTNGLIEKSCHAVFDENGKLVRFGKK